MPQHGKKFTDAAKKVDPKREYSLADAVKLLKETCSAKFNETVGLHARLSIDPRHSDQQGRTTVLLPAGLGKSVRILVFAEGQAARCAEAPADHFVPRGVIIRKMRNYRWTASDIGICVTDIT